MYNVMYCIRISPPAFIGKKFITLIVCLVHREYGDLYRTKVAGFGEIYI